MVESQVGSVITGFSPFSWRGGRGGSEKRKALGSSVTCQMSFVNGSFLAASGPLPNWLGSVESRSPQLSLEARR
jgi:hypothetical protein